MRLFYLVLFFCSGSLSCIDRTPTKQVSIGTLNIRWDSPHDGANRWAHRREHLTEWVFNNRMDVWSFQEAYSEEQLLDMIGALGGCDAVALPETGLVAAVRSDWAITRTATAPKAGTKPCKFTSSSRVSSRSMSAAP